MNLSELFTFIKELLQKDAEVIAGFVVGFITAIGLIGAVGLWRWFNRGSDNPTALKVAIANLKNEKADLTAELNQHKGRVSLLERRLDEDGAKLRNVNKEAAGERATAEARYRDTVRIANQRITQANKGITHLNKTVRAIHDELTAQRGKIAELSQECERLKDESQGQASLGTRLQTLLDDANQVAAGYEQQLAVLADQIREIEATEGRVWERTVGPDVPPFRPLTRGAAPIIAVANLKGGVGKTSLTANLAAAAASKGKRVLVVDLDHQGSLTQLCVSKESMSELRHTGGRFIQDVLKADDDIAALAWRNTVPVRSFAGGGTIRILATDEDLIDVEEQLKTHWLLHPGSADVRYRLRAALHDAQIQDRFDLILFDCPPRLGTACVNALAAADWVLVPVILDRLSTEAVPRLLKWLRHLRAQRLCPDLSVLGVVANRTQQRTGLTTKEKAEREELEAAADRAWQGAVHLFQRFVPSSQLIADAASKAEFAALHKELKSLFEELATEVQGRMTNESGSRVAAVH